MRLIPILMASVLMAALAGCGEGNDQAAATTSPTNPTNPNNPSNPSNPNTPTNFNPFNATGMYLSVLPPGQSPDSDSPHFKDQSKLYESLEYAQKGLQTSELKPNYFKSEKFNPPSAFANIKTVTDNNGHSARIGRDEAFGVPHIYGDTRPDVMFGIGYATAKDRLFLLDVLRHLGRGRLSDFTGPTLNDAINRDRSLARKAGYSEAELRSQIDSVASRYGKAGQQVQNDVKNFVAGLNAYVKKVGSGKLPKPSVYKILKLKPRKFTVRDVVAVTTYFQDRFAAGGGGEIQDAQLLNGIHSQFPNFSDDQACGLWHDLLQSDDPTRPVTTTTSFETQSPPTINTSACPLKAGFAGKYPGAVLIDPGSYQTGGTTLTTTKCVRPQNAPKGGEPVCPNYKEDVVDGSASKPAGRSLLTISRLGRSLSSWLAGQGSRQADPLQRSGRVLAGGGHVSHKHRPRSHSQVPLVSAATMRRNPGDGRSQASDSRSSNAMPLGGGGTATPLWSGVQATLETEARRRVRATIASVNAFLAQGQEGMNLSTAMSNALLITGNRTPSGHPIAVFGPQVGYFEPGILFEFEAHGGGINTRGEAFPGLPYAGIGRGVDYAWSATSAGADITDIRALKLCQPAKGNKGYRYKGQCKPFYKRTDNWTAEPPGGSGAPLKVTRTILRAPEYGPVIGYATVNGQRIGLARQRSTFFHELGSAVGSMQADENKIHNPKSFMKVFNRTTGTLNWFYVDDDHIAYFMAGLLPKRAKGIYPDLPEWGTGQFDWAQTGTGTANSHFSLDNFSPLKAHPHDVDPSRGYLTSWNNAQAPGFWAADSQLSFGPVYRVQALNARIKAALNNGGQVTPGDLVQIMEDGGFTDLRGQEVLPPALKILNQGPLTDAQQKAVDLLTQWVSDGDYQDLGAWRRDRDNDGEYDDRAAVVLMDSWYPRMIDQALPQLVKLEKTDQGNVVPKGRDDHPGAIGSAFHSGYYGYLRRSFKMALGNSERQYKQLHCADNTFPSCRQALLTSLDNALAVLGGISNEANWDGTRDPRTQGDQGGKTVEKTDQIKFSMVSLKTPPPLFWVNRPTWQQVVQPTSSRSR